MFRSVFLALLLVWGVLTATGPFFPTTAPTAAADGEVTCCPFPPPPDEEPYPPTDPNLS